MGGDAWLDKHNELQQNLEESFVDAQELQRLKRSGKDASRISSQIERDTGRAESTFSTLKRMLPSLTLSSSEKAKRESMLADISSAMNRLRSQVQGGGGRGAPPQGFTEYTDRSSLGMQRGEEAAGGKRIENQMMQEQQQMMQGQDVSLDLLLESVNRQKEMGEAISEELDQQSGLLDDLENGMDNTGMVLGRQQQRVEEVLEKAGKGGTLCIIVALSGVLAILTMLALDII